MKSKLLGLLGYTILASAVLALLIRDHIPGRKSFIQHSTFKIQN